jgi:hypothetical protein
LSQIIAGVTRIPTGTTCAKCRFDVGLPQGLRRLMRCVHHGELTAGEFSRGPSFVRRWGARYVVGVPRREYGSADESSPTGSSAAA